MTLPAGTPIGKYVVRKKLAEGGMAEIYLASARGPQGFEKEVAIKRIRPSIANDPGFVEMFVTEARVASRLNHPNLVQIFDFAQHDDTYYIAMEYVRGRSLWEVRKRAQELMSPMASILSAYVGAQVARGLHHAHELRARGQPLGLVHRDVTPHNILLSFDGAVKLTDFGIVKHANRLTAPGTLKGKYAYMSPEQARGEAVDARTDLFALGVVLWELLTGGRLFDSANDLEVLRAVQHSAIAPPARLNPDVPQSLDAITMKALERKPDERYASALELARALEQHVHEHRSAVDDTDVSAYLARLFGEEAIAAPSFTAISEVAPLPIPHVAEPDDFDGTTAIRQHASQPGAGRGRRPHSRRTAFGILALAGLVGAYWLASGRAFAVRGSTAAQSEPLGETEATPAELVAATMANVPEPAVEPEPVSPVLRTGTLVLKAKPWARLYIDRKFKGEIGVSKREFELDEGVHQVTFQHPAGTRTMSIVIEPGKQLAREVDLQQPQVKP